MMHARANTQAETRKPESWMGVRSGLLQRKCACSGGQRCECDEKSASLKRSATGGFESGVVPSIVHEVVNSPGQPLSEPARTFFEPRFGHDFSSVRVHNDARAGESARAVNALAYTVGRDIVFGEGQYQPDTRSGLRLMAHELTHTLQQTAWNRVMPTALEVSSEDDAAERDAESAASRITDGSDFGFVSHTSTPRLQRSPDKDDKSKTAKPPCPTVTPQATNEEFKRAACVRPIPSGTPAECEFTTAQLKALKAAQSEAAGRVRRAKARIGAGREGKSYASELANRLFVADAPSLATVEKLLDKVEPLLSGSSVSFAGRTCADETCKQPPTVAYVTAPGTLPIFICPIAFHEPEGLYRIVLHEAMHWAGVVVKDPKLSEIYCEKFDCQTSCGTSEIADAWMHYINCLGEPLTTKKSFIPEMIKSVEDID